MNLEAVRAFVVVAEEGQFQLAATHLGISQQAVSKRLATLESDLGVRLFTRTAGGARLTLDGQAFLPHARELLRVEQRAANSVRPGRRALRVDVLSYRTAPSAVLRDFHRAHPDVELDLVTIVDSAQAAIAAIQAGTIDASFRAVGSPASRLPPGVEAMSAVDDAHQLLVGPAHPLAGARSVTLEDLVGQRIWMPGMLRGSEWDLYYDDLAEAFGLTIERVGPHFGTEHLLDVLAESSTLANLAGEHTRYLWPDHYDLRRIPVRSPTPVYPHSLVWHRDNAHPVLGTLVDYLASTRVGRPDADIWAPEWGLPR
ncbi:LysR family transcriptional regulator [Parafrankia colletiae]|uniref:LysR family transcriptional regulator n=1 Tax=Parafrankia colletiae TaxID=573497 RepID=A0A1S1QSD4_9ACTN|nr:LysR family transcriptional regulator [Parafrankia colletiae]MCK9901421.1 LysR family transcriptional regulator [Frankia sp. Cpl3]OHV36341.1 LysR family transcriptional regulator [Parafrankia colletiae]